MKETIRLILDHGFHFVELDGGFTPDTWLQEKLMWGGWHLKSIALLLRRQGKGGLPIQHLNGCLHSAILGSQYVDLDEMKAALILLIRGGADVYARDRYGHSVSDIASSKETRFVHATTEQYQYNHDLLLRKIWAEALSACGYDAEEVISTGTRMEELPDNADESTSAQHEDCVCAGCDDSEEEYTNSPPCLMDEGWGAESRYQDDDDGVVSADLLHPQNQYERSLLEGDTNVWRS